MDYLEFFFFFLTMLLIIMFTWVGTADADLGPCRYQHPDPGNREGLKCDG